METFVTFPKALIRFLFRFVFWEFFVILVLVLLCWFLKLLKYVTYSFNSKVWTFILMVY